MLREGKNRMTDYQAFRLFSVGVGTGNEYRIMVLGWWIRNQNSGNSLPCIEINSWGTGGPTTANAAASNGVFTYTSRTPHTYRYLQKILSA